MESMQNVSHATFTGILREAVEVWRKDNGWSRETVVMHIVEAHQRLGADLSTGIVFDPPSRDAFERAKVNADRVFRWLDDVSKDTNHCPPNFVQSILFALPMDRRVMLVNKWLMPVELSCRPAGKGDNGDLECAQVQRFQAIVKAASGAQTSVAELLDGIDPGELERAHFELTNAVDVLQRELRLVEQKRAEQGTPGGHP